jgi:excisionase family DNA binding protein
MKTKAKADVLDIKPKPILLSIREVAERFRVHPITITNWVKRGVLVPIRINARFIRFKLEDVEALEANRQPAGKGSK